MLHIISEAFYSIELISVNISSMEQRHHQTKKSCEGELSWGIRPGGATFNTNLDQVLPHIYFSWIIVKLTKSWVFNRFSWWYRGILNIYTSQDLWFLIFSAETCLYFVNELFLSSPTYRTDFSRIVSVGSFCIIFRWLELSFKSSFITATGSCLHQPENMFEFWIWK